MRRKRLVGARVLGRNLAGFAGTAQSQSAVTIEFDFVDPTSAGWHRLNEFCLHRFDEVGQPGGGWQNVLSQVQSPFRHGLLFDRKSHRFCLSVKTKVYSTLR